MKPVCKEDKFLWNADFSFVKDGLPGKALLECQHLHLCMFQLYPRRLSEWWSLQLHRTLKLCDLTERTSNIFPRFQGRQRLPNQLPCPDRKARSISTYNYNLIVNYCNFTSAQDKLISIQEKTSDQHFSSPLILNSSNLYYSIMYGGTNNSLFSLENKTLRQKYVV